MKKMRLLILSVATMALLPACSTMQEKTYSSNITSQEEAIQTLLSEASIDETGVSAGDVGLGSLTDPFEGINRQVFAFNKAVDDHVIFPFLDGYRAVVPKPARNGVSNFLDNLKTPTRFFNQVLQGDLTGAMDELTRGVVNTIIGVGGVFDVAGYEGLKGEDEDFGQTLGVWGVGHGPYVMVPFVGGVSSRDMTGFGVDMFTDPLRIYLDNVDKEDLNNVRTAAGYVDMKNDLMDILKQLEYGSVDYYASVRSSYYQRREALKNDGNVSPDYGDDVFAGFDSL